MSGKQLTLKEVIKIYFLIDFENVNSEGLQGVEYLLPTDYVEIFYSKDAGKATGYYLQQIKYSNCSFETTKLVRRGKNGLDFYIASRVGELRASGCKDQIAIISKDAGYTAVKDYIDKRYNTKKIILTSTVRAAILSGVENDARRSFASLNSDTVSIEYFANSLRQERNSNIEVVRILDNTKLLNIQYLDRIQKILNEDNHKVPVYRKLVHEFGQKDGLDIYRRIKDQLLTKDDR